jgi:hypothetical protein
VFAAHSDVPRWACHSNACAVVLAVTTSAEPFRIRVLPRPSMKSSVMRRFATFASVVMVNRAASTRSHHRPSTVTDAVAPAAGVGTSSQSGYPVRYPKGWTGP